LGFATSAGDAFTYYIQTKKDPGEGRNVILIRSIIRTRRKNIGTENEYCCNNPDLAGFFLSTQDLEEAETSFTPSQDMDPGELDPGEAQMDQESNQEPLAMIPESDETPDEDNSNELPDDEDAQHLYDQFEGEDAEDKTYQFDKIVDHHFSNGKLILKTRYRLLDDEDILEVPFGILKKDVPLELAKYIKNYVIEEKRGKGFFMEWSTRMLKTHSRCIKRLHRSYNIGKTMRVCHTRRAHQNIS
jgi:hypothetical protein